MIRLPIVNIFLLITLVQFCSCHSEVAFSPMERAFLSSFTIGDSLFFQNQEGKIDTIVISRIDSSQYVERWNRSSNIYISVSIWAKQIPEDTLFESYFQQKGYSYNRKPVKNMFTLKKKEHSEEAGLYYNLKNMIGGKTYWLVQPDTVRLNGSLIKSCYRVYSGTDGGFNNEIYITLKEGLVGYSYEGKTWVRKNSHRAKFGTTEHL